MSDVIGQVLTTLMYILGAGVALVTIMIIYFNSLYKHKAIIKDLVNNNGMIVYDKFRIKTDKDGITWWKFKKLKKLVPPANSECIDVTDKGKMSVIFHRLDVDNFVPVKDSVKDWDEDKKKGYINSLQPYTTSQRALMVNQHRKSERDRKLSVGEMLLKAAPYLTMVLILTIFMIFFNDVVKPSRELSEKLNTIIDERNAIDAKTNEVWLKVLDTLDMTQELTGENFTSQTSSGGVPN